MTTLRATAALTATTLLLAVGPALGTASPAAADAPGDTEVAVYLSAAADTGAYGVYRRPTAGGPPVALVAPNPNLYRDGLVVSQDGSRFAYSEAVLDPDTGDALRERVVVRDVAGPFARNVVDVPLSADSNTSYVAPALSPDGTAVVLSRVVRNPDSLSLSLFRASVFGGAPKPISGTTGLVEAVYLDGGTLLARQIGTRLENQGLVTLPAAGGTRRAAVAGSALGDSGDFQVSPAGDKVLYTTYDESEDEETLTSSTSVATLDRSGPAPVLRPSAAPPVTSGELDNSPTWRRDGTSLLFTRAQAGNEDNSDIWSVPVGEPAAAAPFFAPTPAVDDYEVVVAKVDATPPGAITSTGVAVLAGTTASIPLTSYPADRDWSGTYVRRTAGGVTRTTLAPVSARVVDTAMTVGTTYSYTFQAVDSSGNLGPVSLPRLITATAPPSFTTTDPTSSGSVTPSFPVTLSTSNARTTRYSVDVGRNGGAYAPWLSAVTGGVQVFGSGSGVGRRATTSTPGSTYRFVGLAYDDHGNRTATVLTPRRAVVPFDNGALTRVGVTQAVARPGAYGGDTLFLKTSGAQASIRIAGDRVQVIGERGPTAGRFVVFDNGVRLAVVDTRASARQVRQVLFTAALSRSTNHTITVRAEGTAGRPTVVVDAISTRRP